MVSIRPYQPASDEAGVFGLWQETFGSTWPLTRDVFRQVTIGTGVYRDGDHFVAEERGAPVGFVATQADQSASPPRAGHISALLVAPGRRRRGTGRALHDAAIMRLRETGVHQARLGGGDAYLWPGVPSTLAPALNFFRVCGWSFAETSYDLVQDLHGYKTPPELYRRVVAQGVILDIGTQGQAPELLAFVDREFPSWQASYRSVAALGDYGDFLLARDQDRRVIGAVIMYSPRSHLQRIDARWKTLLGEDAGAIGAAGVAASERRRGVAHALVARASEIVRDRGARQGFIGWAWMIGLYGELGYRVWQEYTMGKRPVA